MAKRRLKSVKNAMSFVILKWRCALLAARLSRLQKQKNFSFATWTSWALGKAKWMLGVGFGVATLATQAARKWSR
jgi:hypothetical protein